MLTLKYKEAMEQEERHFRNCVWGKSGAGVSRWFILIGMLVALTLSLLNIVILNSNYPEEKWRKKKISFTEQLKANYGNKMTGALSH